MSDQPKTVGGIVPVICENADGTCWISGGNFRELHYDGTWYSGRATDYWPTREAAQRFIDRHADQPKPTAADITDHKYLDPVCGEQGCQSLVYRHQAEVYRKQMVEAEAIVKELGVQVGNLTGELDWQKKQTEYIRDLANKSEAELAAAHQLLKDLKDSDMPSDLVGAVNYMIDHSNEGWSRVAAERTAAISIAATCLNAGCSGDRSSTPSAVKEMATKLADAKAELARVNEKLRVASDQILRVERVLDDTSYASRINQLNAIREVLNDPTPLTELDENYNDLGERYTVLEAQLADANSRLAKARKALARLWQWSELSPFAQSVLDEAQAALADGEG